MRVFVAFPSQPEAVSRVIDEAVRLAQQVKGSGFCTTWRELDVPGRFLGERVTTAIDGHDVVAADVTSLNFNVTYELGFAIG